MAINAMVRTGEMNGSRPPSVSSSVSSAVPSPPPDSPRASQVHPRLCHHCAELGLPDLQELYHLRFLLPEPIAWAPEK